MPRVHWYDGLWLIVIVGKPYSHELINENPTIALISNDLGKF